MAANIGGIACDFVHGAGLENVQRADVYQLPGVDGYGAQQLGKGDAPFRFTAVKYDTDELLQTWIEDIRGKVGDLITIVDDWGHSYTKCLINRAGIPRQTPDADPENCRCEILLEGVYTPGGD